jgi:hypothetical protein
MFMAQTKQNQGLNERLQKIIGDDARDDTSHGSLGVGASSGRTAGYAGGGGRAGGYGSGIGPGSGGVPGAVWSLMGRAVSHGGVKHIREDQRAHQSRHNFDGVLPDALSRSQQPKLSARRRVNRRGPHGARAGTLDQRVSRAPPPRSYAGIFPNF